MKLIRPEIKDELARAVLYLAQERATEVYAPTYTQFINDLVFEEWQRKHPNMMFPDENGVLMKLRCTPELVNP